MTSFDFFIDDNLDEKVTDWTKIFMNLRKCYPIIYGQVCFY